MRRVAAHIIALLALVVMVWLGAWFAQDSGYVLVQLRGWSMETTVPVMLVVIGGMAAAALIGRIMWVWPRELGRRTALNRKHKLLEQGLLGLQEGNFQKAEKALSKLASKGDSVAAYLVAAEAARSNDNTENSRKLLQKALDHGGADFTVRLKQADWMLQEKQYQPAYEILNKLHDQKPRHEKVLELLYEAARAAGHEEKATRLHKVLVRRKLLDPKALTDLEQDARLARVVRAQEDELVTLWKELSRVEKTDKSVICIFSSRYIELENYEQARKLLEPALKKERDNDLLLVFGKITGGGQKQRVQMAEKWLEESPENCVLLRVLGRMCLAAELWGKAKDYLEASLSIEPSAEAYEILARLAKQFNQSEAAYSYYDNAARVRNGELPNNMLEWDIAEAARTMMLSH